MTTNAVWLKIDAERVANALQQACENLGGVEHELALDFSAVRRIDPGAIRAMEKLVVAADAQGIKVMLRGVNVDVYKVLKLVKLAPRFTFLN
jgi:anti-anti-sigma regulatory factor